MLKFDSYQISNESVSIDSSKKLSFIILQVIMDVLFFYPLASSVLYCNYHTTFYLMRLLGLLATPPIVTLIALSFIKGRPASIFTIAFVFALFFISPVSNLEKFIYALFYIFPFAYINLSKLNKNIMNFHGIIFFICAEAILLLNLSIDYNLGCPLIQYITLICAFLFSIVFLFYYGKTRTSLITNVEKKYSSKHLAEFTANSKKALAMIISLFSLVIFTVLIPTSRINKLLDTKASSLLNTLNDGFKTNPKNLPKQNIGYAPSIHKANNAMPKISTGAAWFYFILILSIILIAVVLWFLIIKYILSSIKFSHKAGDTNATFLKEDLKKDLHAHLIPKIRLNLSNKEKARKLYKKLVKSYTSKGLNLKASYTANEIKNEIFELTEDDIQKANNLYTKSRYSNYEPSNEDLNSMRRK